MSELLDNQTYAWTGPTPENDANSPLYYAQFLQAFTNKHGVRIVMRRIDGQLASIVISAAEALKFGDGLALAAHAHKERKV